MVHRKILKMNRRLQSGDENQGEKSRQAGPGKKKRPGVQKRQGIRVLKIWNPAAF